ncbi:hypothetical protein A3F00_01060 [Candidatus Daviesbacteria bacterium RIFCSPHIGHO2_12_FULL_37_11]|uniref:ABC transporter permease n=1 Tax=Candidatus Daviesbacteria bacterium RIFCSPHIGHO2_12_FULL_37_11 TaxID=1797777 RepID=A0A1F5K962_9BACT|nr:MAG: hypothetical protein A2769_00030 [Candidatus Daviesbacteria bacterium RIFCSPHIGHO2_01_FULL_37_27]OGE37439.1 MAG: hypothetical protein A3F00_01060 [Candidatus Daviesbacteria bacterium RIFCSPHIGHO2_12_FULL_37_11]OGE44726.1 MAG: hypothetical protein A3B39_01430 [Candidatus Daviesbacteria bacterium RIFCSPLOWO2_01_FULL_37_10]
MKKYLKVWWIFTFNSFQSQLLTRWAVLLFLISKLLRFFIFVVFIVLLLNKTNTLASYTLNQTLFFFLTFSLIDSLVQTIFREVYRFRPAIINGTFDFYLIKPFSPLFRALATGPDIIDLILLVPLFGAIVYFMIQLNISDPLRVGIYIFLIFIALIISLAFHILVLSLAVFTTEIDHAILVYRDITGMGRFPMDIYREPLRGILTYLLPVGIMMSFPVQALIGILSPVLILYAAVFAFILLFAAMKVWNISLQHYSSASS